jgi:hypothetical protein
MSTNKQIVIFDNEPNTLTLNPFRVRWQQDDSNRTLNIAVEDTSADTNNADNSVTPETLKSFSISVNSGPEENLPFDPRQVITQQIASLTNQRAAIYQFLLDYSKFRPGRNSIELLDTTFQRRLIGKISFFLKEEPMTSTNVTLQRPGIEPTADQVLWDYISNHALYFQEYEKFIDTILSGPDNIIANRKGKFFDNNPDADDLSHNRQVSKIRSPFIKSEEYNLIKFATDFYMLAKFGLNPLQVSSYTKNKVLPYYDIIIDKIRDDVDLKNLAGDSYDREVERLENPIMIELIWNYWMEQGMLVQTMNVINLHFQNIKVTRYPSPLDRMHTDPLRPLSHILWGNIQDEQHRLSLPRRVSEYDHEYGLALTGRAVPQVNFSDTRVKFLEAFHNLLNLSFVYSKESDDTTYIADAFPILTALREVHLLLAEGNHNAYGNLTWTARQEMMMQQYILARPEMREFLGGRIMVPYPETWMDRVDTMRHIMGWGATSILHFYELALHGEQILLSIRYGNWSDATLDRTDAANWAQKFRNSIYRYIHAYRTVTGVDLSAEKIQSTELFALQPTYLIQQRLLEEKPGFSLQQRTLISRNRKAS